MGCLFRGNRYRELVSRGNHDRDRVDRGVYAEDYITGTGFFSGDIGYYSSCYVFAGEFRDDYRVVVRGD